MSNTLETLGLSIPSSVTKQAMAQAILDNVRDNRTRVQTSIRGTFSKFVSNDVYTLTPEVVDKVIAELAKGKESLSQAQKDYDEAFEQFQTTRTNTT